MIRWNLEVRRWNDSPAKNAAGESSGVALESLFPQNNGALESSSVSLEPDSRKKMSRWNLTPLGTLKLQTQKGWGA